MRTTPSGAPLEAQATPPGVDLEEVAPTWRGVLHAYAFWFALAAAAILVSVAPSAEARVASGIYGAGMCALFAVSGLYHRWRWNPRWRPLVRKLDHSTIFVFIAASTTPMAVLVLDGPLRTGVLMLAWLGALAGTAMSTAWIDAPRGLVAFSYVAVGCASVAGLPQILSSLTITPLLLLGVGSLMYILGAAVYATRRPDPWPRTFGFHEVFHTMVVAAVAIHFVAMMFWIVPAATQA
jgi:hemolysin III